MPAVTEPTAAEALLALSKWIDAGNAHRAPEALLWHRVAKVGEENGELIDALIGALGGNPRKGVTNGMDKVVDEALDTALSALGAVEHIRGHLGDAFELLAAHAITTARRAGVIPQEDQS